MSREGDAVHLEGTAVQFDAEDYNFLGGRCSSPGKTAVQYDGENYSLPGRCSPPGKPAVQYD